MMRLPLRRQVKSSTPSMVSDDLRSHTSALQHLIEAAAVGERRTSNIRDSFIRVRELEDMGLIEIVGNRFSGKSRAALFVRGDPAKVRNGDFWYNSLADTFRGCIAGDIVDIPGSGVGGSAWGAITGTLADQVDLQAALDAKADAADFDSGVYTPTLTNVANLAGSTAYECQYLRHGTTVAVSGKIAVDPTAGGVLTQLGISLPVASNFGAEEDCGGVAFASGVAGMGAAIRGDAANNRAELAYIAAAVTNQPMHFHFMYQVI